MSRQTYTLLVTIVDEKPPTPKELEQMIERALEEGIREWQSCSSAQASAFNGDALDAIGMPKMRQAKRLHAELRKP